jgi:hypothetical protein
MASSRAMLLGPNLDAGRLGEVMEGLPGLVLGKLGAMEIGADMDAAIGGSGRKLLISSLIGLHIH